MLKMLTNTVVLFLRDILPVFILFSYLSVMYGRLYKHALIQFSAVGLALVLSTIILAFYEQVSDLFNGNGIEWLKVVFVSCAFISLLLAQIKRIDIAKSHLFFCALVLLMIVHMNSFSLYFRIYYTSNDDNYELLIGCAIGLGICVSFYFLFSFVVYELWQSKYRVLVLFLWSVFTASQLSVVANYLQQLDVVTVGTRRLYNVKAWINEDSEYGFFLKALTGFDVSPSVFYILLIFVSFSIMFCLTLYNQHTSKEEFA